LNWGYTHFDNIMSAFLTIFQSVTMEGWSVVMLMTEDAASFAIARLFFIVLILFGSFLVLNLLLAILEDNFTSSKDEEMERTLDISKRSDVSNDGSGKFKFVINGGTTTNIYEEHGVLYRFVTHRLFTNFVTCLIILNTVILSLDVYPTNDKLEFWTELLNFILTLMFAIEMGLKIVALGIRDYCSDYFNLFDGFIVIFSFIEIYITPPSFLTDDSSAGGGGISALRSFRLFRIFKLAREWTSMRILLGTLLKTVFDISNFCLLLILFMYVYALIGMQFFANKMRFDDDGYAIAIGEPGWNETLSPRPNFDTLVWSFTTVFVVLSGENWNTIMYDARRASSAEVAVSYFMSLIVFGMFIVMNLFLAILLSNFTSDNNGAQDDEEEENSMVRENQVAPEMLTPRTGLRRSNTGVALETAIRKMIKDPELAKKTEANDSTFPLNAGKALMFLGPTHPIRYWCARIIDHPVFDKIVLVLIAISSVALALSSPLNNPYSKKQEFLDVLDIILTVLFTIEMCLKIVALGFCFQPRAYLRNSWNILDFIVVLISLIDLGIGDAAGGGLSFLRALRALRAFRPLRVISRAPGLKKVVNTMFLALPDVFNVGSVCLIFFLIFSIVGTNYLKGNFRACQGDVFDSMISEFPERMALLEKGEADNYYWSDYTATEKSWFGPESNFTLVFDGNCTATWPSAPCCNDWPSDVSGTNPTSKQICECLGANWDLDEINQRFDHIGWALLTFFEISTTEAWVDVMLAAVDSNGVEYQPILNNRRFYIVFFCLFIVVGSYLVMNLFVGVIIDNFQRQSQDEDFILLTEQQQLFVKTQKIVSKLKPLRKQKPPGYPLGDLAFKIIDHPAFEPFIMSCICLNTVTLAMQYFGQSDAYALFLTIANYIFTGIFIMEAVTKLLGLKMKYFKEGWNRFDFVIVLASIVGLFVSFGSAATIVRTFRVGRVIRLINGAETLNQLFQTLLSTMVGLWNVAALLFLMLFIFSVMGVQLFSEVALHDDLTEHLNFQRFSRALVTLITFSTGENWNGFMHSVASDVDGCVSDPEYDENMCGYVSESQNPSCIPLNGCGKRASIFAFMGMFTLTINFILINLFVGVILEDFKGQAPNDIMSKKDLKRFSEHWSLYDPDATYFMPFSMLDEFLRTLFSPWGVDAGIDKKELHTKIARWKLTIYKGNMIHFYDVIHSVSQDVLEQQALDRGIEIADQNLEDAMAKVLHAHNKVQEDHEVLPSGESINIEHHYAAQILQNSFRRLKDRHKESMHLSESDSGRPLLMSDSQTNSGIPEDIDDISRRKELLAEEKDGLPSRSQKGVPRMGSIESFPESKDVSTLGGNDGDNENFDSPRFQGSNNAGTMGQQTADSAAMLAIESGRRKSSKSSPFYGDRPPAKSNPEEGSRRPSNDLKPPYQVKKQNSKIRKLGQTKGTHFSSSEMGKPSNSSLIQGEQDGNKLSSSAKMVSDTANKKKQHH